MTALAEVLIWRLTWWLLRLLWFPLLVIGAIYYVVVPALITVGQLLLSPAGVLVAAILVLWLWRR